MEIGRKMWERHEQGEKVKYRKGEKGVEKEGGIFRGENKKDSMGVRGQTRY